VTRTILPRGGRFSRSGACGWRARRAYRASTELWPSG
jgi:hypothetical protein